MLQSRAPAQEVKRISIQDIQGPQSDVLKNILSISPKRNMLYKDYEQ
jgi:hypothetical protein